MTTLEEARELYERGELTRDCDCKVFPCEHVLKFFGLLCTYCGAEPCECDW